MIQIPAETTAFASFQTWGSKIDPQMLVLMMRGRRREKPKSGASASNLGSRVRFFVCSCQDLPEVAWRSLGGGSPKGLDKQP